MKKKAHKKLEHKCLTEHSGKLDTLNTIGKREERKILVKTRKKK